MINYVEISADGSRILFTERYDELFPDIAANDESVFDLYSYKTATASLSLVSQSINGGKANGSSVYPRLASDGNRAVFLSTATDLNNQPSVSFYHSIFHYDFSTGLMLNESQTVFNPDTVLTSVDIPRISSDQRYALYISRTPNFIEGVFGSGNDSNLFLLDRSTDTHSLIAKYITGLSDISASGNYIAFMSDFLQPHADIDLGASNVFLYDRLSASYTLIAEVGNGLHLSVNDNGVVVFETNNGIAANDSNGSKDIYAYNPMMQTVSLISEDLSGVAAGGNNPNIGGQGNNIWISFNSASDNLINNDSNGADDIFFVKYPAGSIARASQTIAGVEANADSLSNTISNDGSTIVFVSEATNLTADDYTLADSRQVFTYNRITQQITLASKNENGMPISATSSGIYFASISDTGQYVSYVYNDDGDGLDFAEDTDHLPDVILFDTVTQVPKLISKHLDGTQSNGRVYLLTQVVEDTSVSPALLGVIFAADGGDLTELPHHPGHQEAYLYQQGGPGINFSLSIQGPGVVLGAAGFVCSDTCQTNYSIGSDVTLTAIAHAGMQFVGWQVDYGNCNDDTNPCELIMDRNKNLTAIFLDSADVIFADDFE